MGNNGKNNSAESTTAISLLIASVFLILLGIVFLIQANEYRALNVTFGTVVNGVYHEQEHSNIGGNSKAMEYYQDRATICFIFGASFGISGLILRSRAKKKNAQASTHSQRTEKNWSGVKNTTNISATATLYKSHKMCPNCGEENSSNELFCHHCGMQL